MQTEVRIHTTVLSGHRIEVLAPQLMEGTSVDVLVVPHEAAPASGRRAIRQMPMERRRELLARESDRLAAYYDSTAQERSDWEGGDIVE